MPKFDMNSIAESVRKEFKDRPTLSDRVGIGNKLKQLKKEDFLLMPQWWVDATNTPGLPHGAAVQLAGKTDSGKTSAALEAIKAAIDQGYGVVYVETENKTSERDLINKDIDPSQVFIIRTTISEIAYDLLFSFWDEFNKKYSGTPLLIVFDSYGNLLSQRDSELNMTDGKQQPGGKGKSNRLGLSKLISRFEQSSKTCLLIVNYTYNNIGSVGRTNAGGDALGLFSSLIYQTSRKGWLEKTVKGEKVRIGAQVQWTLYKNHVYKDNPGPKQVVINITSEGITCVNKSDNIDSNEDE